MDISIIVLSRCKNPVPNGLFIAASLAINTLDISAKADRLSADCNCSEATNRDLNLLETLFSLVSSTITTRQIITT